MVLKVSEAQELGLEPFTEEQKVELNKEIEALRDWDAPEPPKEEEQTKPEDKKEKEEKPEEKPEEQKKEEQPETDKKAEEPEEETPEQKAEKDKAEQARLEKIAKEEGLTIEQVKENEAKDKSVAERHSGDPLKIARALRKEQSEYGKIKAENDKLKAFKAQVDEERTRFNEQKFNADALKNRDRIIETYREKFPDEADESDDALFERGKVLIKQALKAKEAERYSQIRSEAEAKREELVTSLPEDLKEYVPEVREMLKSCADEQVLDKEFDVTFLATYQRGKRFTKDYVKSLEDAAYKRGLEQPKIMAEQTRVKGARTSAKGGSSPTITLTEAQKRRAEVVYSSQKDWTDEQKWAEYQTHDLKNDF